MRWKLKKNRQLVCLIGLSVNKVFGKLKLTSDEIWWLDLRERHSCQWFDPFWELQDVFEASTSQRERRRSRDLSCVDQHLSLSICGGLGDPWPSRKVYSVQKKVIKIQLSTHFRVFSMTNLPSCDVAKHKNDAKRKISFVCFVTPVAMSSCCYSKTANAADNKSWNFQEKEKVRLRSNSQTSVVRLKPVLKRTAFHKPSKFNFASKGVIRLSDAFAWFFYLQKFHRLRFACFQLTWCYHVMLSWTSRSSFA
jgi:hypothetical protein